MDKVENNVTAEIVGFKLTNGEEIIGTVNLKTDSGVVLGDILAVYTDRHEGIVMLDRWVYHNTAGICRVNYSHVIAEYVPNNKILESYSEFVKESAERRKVAELEDGPSKLPELEPTGNTVVDSNIKLFNNNKPDPKKSN